MPEQLTFDLARIPSLGREDFFVSDANAVAVAMIEGWRDWPLGKCILAGPEGSGKSHLAHIWIGMAGAALVSADKLAEANGPLCVEDVDQMLGDKAWEETLFHTHNRMAENGWPLLMTGGAQTWTFALPDLESRLKAASMARIDQPDDALLQAMLMKLFADKQLAVAPDVFSYITQRIERSYRAVQTFVDTLDQASLQEKRNITRMFAGKILDRVESC